jgi:hypothetical protein
VHRWFPWNALPNLCLLFLCQVLWLPPAILATKQAEIRRITVQSQPEANSYKDPISKANKQNPIQKKTLPNKKPSDN